MKIKNIVITIKKELRSIFRDKKTIKRLLIFPLIIPGMIFLYSYLYGINEKDYKIGINYETNEVEKSILDQVHLEILNYNSLEEMQKAYEKGNISGYITLTNNKYTVYTNKDSEDGMFVSSYTTTYLETYKEALAQNYFIEHGINLEEAYSAISYDFVSLEGENFFLQLIFSVAFTYIIMAIVTATTNMAISATAEEKENGTLETILTFPIKSGELIIGKYFAAVIIGFISALIGLILALLSFAISTKHFDVFTSVNFNISITSVVLSLIVVFSAALFIAGIAIALTCFAKSYKEAQSSSQFLTFLTIIPMFLSILSIKISTFFYLIPIANYTQILIDISSGNVNILNVLLVLISSILYVFVVIKIIIKLYKSEKILFAN